MSFYDRDDVHGLLGVVFFAGAVFGYLIATIARMVAG